jgi:membrane fusion protein, multidrug efflux system
MMKYFLMLLAAFFTAGCADKNSTSLSDKVPEFPVIEVASRDTIMIKDFVAEIRAQRFVEIRAREQGYIDEVFVDEGKPVKTGQLLFKIHDDEYKADVSKAEANVHSAIAEAQALQMQVENVTILVDKNVVSPTELRLAKAKVAVADAAVEVAKADLSRAKIRLSHTDIRAPFDGIIDRFTLRIGSLINEGSLLTSVFDSRFIFAYFKVSEKEYLEYVKQAPGSQRANKIELILADGTIHPFRGIVETMQVEFDNTSGTIAFRARFENPENIVRHGSSGKVRLTYPVRNAIMIPQKSTFEIQDKTYVFLIDANNVAKMTSFLPRSRIANYYIVDSGVKPSDLIVYEGIKDLRDGMKITPVKVKPDGESVVATPDKPQTESGK